MQFFSQPLSYYLLWGSLIIVFGFFEAVTAQLVSIWFVIGAVAALIAALLHASVLVQVIVFVAVSIIALLITRPLVKKYVNPKKEPTNADKVIGQTGIVIEDIDNIDGFGQVKVDGKVWSARSVDSVVITAGSEVTVEKIEGVKLLVSPKD